MPLADLARCLIAAVFSGLMIWAAIGDIRSRLIPNLLVLLVIGLYLPLAVVNGGAGLVSSLWAFGAALALGVVLWSFKIMGAGDSKLFAAAALFTGLGFLPAFALGVALSGGVVALASFASRPQRALAMITLRGKGDWGRGVPYGVAIAAGGIAVVWAAMFGMLVPFDLTGRGGDPAHEPLRPLEIARSLELPRL